MVGLVSKNTNPAGRLASRGLASAGADSCTPGRCLDTKLASMPSQYFREGVPEAGFEPARRCRHTPARCARLPVSPLGHVRENGETKKTHWQVTPRSHG